MALYFLLKRRVALAIWKLRCGSEAFCWLLLEGMVDRKLGDCRQLLERELEVEAQTGRVNGKLKDETNPEVNLSRDYSNLKLLASICRLLEG